MKYLYQISRVLLGSVFIFSGAIKGIDPQGSAYKFVDYFEAFGWDILVSSNLGIPLICALALAFAEVLVGLSLFFNYKIKCGSIGSILFMLLFTPLTLYLAIYEPVGDCGCFGDAVKLDNWETFYKNIVLSILSITVLKGRSDIYPIFSKFYRRTLFTAALIGYIYITTYSTLYLPIVDFRPYSIGTDIIESSNIPEGAVEDKFETTLLYLNRVTGEKREFTEDNIPWQDTVNWQFDSMSEPKLLVKGYEPKIKDFLISDRSGNDLFDIYINEESDLLIWVSYSLNSASSRNIDKIHNIYNRALESGVEMIGISGSSESDVDRYINSNNILFKIYHCDELTLKTMIRSNPGIISVRGGIIENKWHNREFSGDIVE